MSVNTPPNPNVATFNNLYWISADNFITEEFANKNYLKFPIAQGKETLQAVDVNGTSNFNALSTFHNGIDSFQSVSISTALGSTSTPSLIIEDNGTAKGLYFIPNSILSGYNPSISAGDIEIFAKGSAVNTETLALTTWSQTNTGIKIAPTSVRMGAGSNTNTATTSILCDGTNITLTSPNPPISTATQPVPTTSSNQIPTCAWVQSAIAAVPVTQKTYTTQYTSTQSVTLPTNCIGISVRCIGQGGNAGAPDDGNGGNWGAGGSGGGGGTCFNQGIIPLYAGTIIQLNFSGYTEIVLTSFSNAILCRASAGGNGGNASGSTGGSAGVGGGASNLNTAYADWSTKNGSNGIAGGSNLSYQNYSQIPATAGSPVGISFSDTGFGCGQRWNGNAGSINAPTQGAIPKPTGVCYITYYLK